jgi:predicted N-acetyltransferase YhbS
MCVFVAEFNGGVIGTVACKKVNTNEGHLRGMAVLPEWQRSAVAEALLGAAEEKLRRQGCARVTLD